MKKGMLCQYDMETVMRDGTILRGDLYLPTGPGAYPTLLLRTVFRKDEMGRSFGAYDPRYFVERGYAVFIQDVRGLGRSDGQFERFIADGPDGYDTIEWLAQQPFCTGKVGMIGEYFSGYLQLMAAFEQPPHLYAICPVKTSVSINRDCDNKGFMFSSHIGWCTSRQVHMLMDGRYDQETTEKYLPVLRSWLKDYPQSQLGSLPLRDMPALKETPFPLFRSYFEHLVDGYDDLALMDQEGRGRDVSSIRVPAFYISSWFDSARTALIDHCLAQRAAGVDSRVLIAPWQPGEPMACADGALSSGVSTHDVQHEMVQWFDYWLKAGQAPDWASFRVSEPASGLSYSGDHWPPACAVSTFYLTGQMTLASKPEAASGRAVYKHDPHAALPYQGYGWNKAPTSDGRVISFFSEEMPETKALLGYVRSKLWVSTTASDADVMLTFGYCTSSGQRYHLCDGAVRLRFSDNWTAHPIEPDQIYPVTIDMGHLCAQIPKGSRLYLEVSGSAFPKYDINHGTGCAPADDVSFCASENTIWCSPAYPSCLDLPFADHVQA